MINIYCYCFLLLLLLFIFCHKQIMSENKSGATHLFWPMYLRIWYMITIMSVNITQLEPLISDNFDWFVRLHECRIIILIILYILSSFNYANAHLIQLMPAAQLIFTHYEEKLKLQLYISHKSHGQMSRIKINIGFNHCQSAKTATLRQL